MNPNFAHDVEYLKQIFFSNASDDDRLWAARNLAEISPQEGIIYLLQRINEPSRVMQRGILEIIEKVIHIPGKVDISKLIPYLQIFERFQHESDWQIRVSSLEILIRINPQKQFDYLIPATEDPDVDIRELALKKIQLFGEKAHPYILKMLLDSRMKIIIQALDIALKEKIDIPVLYLEKLRMRNELPIQVRFVNYISSAVEKKPEKYLNIIVNNLNSPIGYIQAKAIETLTKLQNPLLIPQLFSKLQHPEEDVVIKAMEAIVLFQEKTLYPEIIRFLKDHRRTIRKKAIELVDGLGDSNYVPTIIPLLADPFFEIREAAYEVMLKNKEPKAIISLLERLKYGLDAEKTQIIQILDQFSFFELILPFTQEFRNQNNVHPYILEKLQSQFPSLELLINLQNLSIPYLIEQLSDPQHEFAVALLLQGWGYKALEPLKQKLNKISPSDIDPGTIHLKIIIKELIDRIETDHIMPISDEMSLLL